jgi:hypothetical protein
MSSWMDKLWSDPDKKDKPEIVESIPGVSTSTPSTPGVIPGVTPSAVFNTSTNAAPAVPVESQEIPSEYIEFFNKVFTERNIPGPDFFEFFQALSAMESLPIDESAKFNAAFATLATQGVTKEKLIETAKVYIQAAQEKTTEFENTVKAKSNEAQKAVTAAEAKLKSIQDQLAALQKQNEAAALEIEQAKMAYAAYPTKIANFKRALDKFTGAINSRVEKINAFIK